MEQEQAEWEAIITDTHLHPVLYSAATKQRLMKVQKAKRRIV
jgi:hypothetical protein